MKNKQETLTTLFSLGTVQEKYDALRKLIAARKHHAASKDKGFQIGIDGLLETVGDTSAQDKDRLLAVATLGRLASSIKRLRATIYDSLQVALAKELPEPFLLEEPDDRSYVGYACEQVQPKWGVDYCANAIVYEETGEQSRVAFLKALLMMKPDLSAVLMELAGVIRSFIPETEDPGTSIAKRLKRLMDGLQVAMAEIRGEPGDEPGKQLASLCWAAFKDVPVSKKVDTLIDTTAGVAGVIHEVVRLRFSLATEATTYSALKVVKSLQPTNVWAKNAPQSKALLQVVQDISEAMLILAKQGITDDSLAGQLVIACGDKKTARQRMKKLAQMPGVANNVKNWLAEGKNEAPLDVAIGESQQLNDDCQLAELLIDAQRFQALESVGKQQILPEIEMLDPRLGESVQRLMQNGVTICDAIAVMAKRKNLRVRGTSGDIEEYAPMEHEIIGERNGVRQVCIVRPVVEQVRDSGVSFVIIKGLVKKVE
ncbi:MAG: hypothetical protein PF442_04130 [Desulfobulbaceae bacterium]|jgi:hypothetical protein|nr:hypothetical protein [Desulfobulbaceae bacterium]